MSGRLLVFSGAGLSAESGIPTFRDSDGLWQGHDPMQVAHISTWVKNAELVFDFYNQRRTEMFDKQPNAVHRMIAQLENRLGVERVKNFTQNVDDLLERGGCDPANVVHVHGKINEMNCVHCDYRWDIGHAPQSFALQCPNCSRMGTVKPGIVMFGEVAPEYENMITTFQSSTEEDVVLVIGTSGNVVPMTWIVKPRRVLDMPMQILLNKEPCMVNVGDFHHYFSGPASTHVNTVAELILDYLRA